MHVIPQGRSARIPYGLGLTMILWMIPLGPQSDIALCASFQTPSSDAAAERLAPFAFDGVAVDGREARSYTGGTVLVSPISFRVTRWLKRGSAAVVVAPDGEQHVRLWDGRYARLPDSLLGHYSTDITVRFDGEIEAHRGQTWRIFGTNENGVNFTCTNLLGSHRIRSDRTAASPLRTPRDRSERAGIGALAVGFVVLALLIAGLSVLAIRRGT